MRHKFRNQLNCVPLNYEIGEAYKGKPQNSVICLSRIIIGVGKKQGCLLSKDWLGSEMVS